MLLTDVNDLVNLFSPAGGDGPAVFVVDAIDRNTTGAGAGNTGLIAASGTAVPEPSSYLGVIAGFGVLGWIARRRLNASVVS
jgi:hypothetical protein